MVIELLNSEISMIHWISILQTKIFHFQMTM